MASGQSYVMPRGLREIVNALLAELVVLMNDNGCCDGGE